MAAFELIKRKLLNFAEKQTASEQLGTKPSMQEIATAGNGRDITRGYIPDNMIMSAGDTVLSQRGGGDYAIYDDIARDDQVKTCRGQRELALIAKEWGVTPADNSRKAKYAADRVIQLLDRLAWDEKTQKMLSAVLYGHAAAELIWATDGTEITLDDIKVRNRSRFGFLPSGELRLKTFGTMTQGEALPPAKFWAFSCGADHDDDPYGLGLGHYLYWPVYFKKNGLKSWLTFLEKFGQPTAVGKYPSSASDPEKSRLLQALSAIQSSTGIRIPESMSIELLEATRSGTADYTALYDRMNSAISKVYLGHTGSTDSTPGKLGGESNASDVRDDLIKADADLICGSFNRTVVKWLAHYNGDPATLLPQVWRKTEPQEDLKASADKDKVIFDMGFKPSLKYINDKYEGDYTEVTPNNPTPASQPGQPDNAAQFAETVDVDPTPVTAQTDLLAHAAGASIKTMVDVIRAKTEKAKSLEALRDDLLASYGDLDSGELAKVMTLAFAAADLSGRFDVSEGS